MVEPWIVITILGAFFQNLRSALQKRSTSNLSILGASYTRFLFAFPFAILYLLVIDIATNYTLPSVNQKFFIYCFAGGVAQILFTVFLISLFGSRNFAIGTVYSKTEIIQVALLAYLILGEPLSSPALLAISLTLLGVLLLTLSDQTISLKRFLREANGRSTLVGLSSGAALGASVVFYRGAALSLEYAGPIFVAAAFTLLVALAFQTFVMGVWIFLKESGTFGHIRNYWVGSLSVGVAGILASICWFTAFTLHNAAEVRALGQIELVFTFLFSLLLFKEKTSVRELCGIVLVMLGVLVLVLGA